MRDASVAASAACALALPALAVETSNFDLGTTRDLVALCSIQPDDPLYAEALQFCYGYMAGLAQFQVLPHFPCHGSSFRGGMSMWEELNPP
jgi:hypothetical protein